jgi:hypothetical protein
VNIAEYLDEVRKAFESGHATEHSYRKALQGLFESIDPSLTIINEAKQSEGGMPDFLFLRGEIPFGWAEAKDIDKDVIKLKGYSKDQRKRYEAAYPNLIYTNGVDFEFIREGEQIHFVSIADFLMGLQPNPDRFGELERQLKLFAEQKPISIRSAAKLAEMMAAKAAIIKDELQIALADDHDFRSDLGGQYKSFKANTPSFGQLRCRIVNSSTRLRQKPLGTLSRNLARGLSAISKPFRSMTCSHRMALQRPVSSLSEVGERQGLYQQSPVFRRRAEDRVGVPHRRVPAGAEVAEGPARAFPLVRGRHALSADRQNPIGDGPDHEGNRAAARLNGGFFGGLFRTKNPKIVTLQRDIDAILVLSWHQHSNPISPG